MSIPVSTMAAVSKAYGLSAPVPEYRFCERGWRLDWAWVEDKIAIEIQGGLFVQGRHNQGASLVKEYEKLNEAQVMGWRVFLVTPQQVNNGLAFELVKRALTP